MKRKLFTAVCFLLAAAMLPSGASAAGAGKGPKKEVGIQLYSVRSLIGVFGKSEGDYKPVLQALADMGYTFVEAASYNDGKFYGQTPEQFKADVEAVGMKVLSSHCTRNLSDDLFRAIRDSGGVVGLNLYTDFLGGGGMDAVVRHVEHLLDLGGDRTLALGGDLDGCDTLGGGITGVQDYPKLYAAIKARGYDAALLQDLFADNWLRVLPK